MGLEIIGAGFGRTGTQSMKKALEQIGFGPCHHMDEVFRNAERQLPLWHKLALTGQKDWDEIFDGYRAAVDWPSARFWSELADYYPSARVLLTVRSAESWYKSFSQTILKIMRNPDEVPEGPEKMFAEMVWAIVHEQSLGGASNDPEKAMAHFEENCRKAMESIEPGRLLVYELGSGWEPLCQWLDVPVPDTPFPKGNNVEQFFQRGD